MPLPPRLLAAPLRFAAVATVLTAAPLAADEGMWLFTAPPREQLRERYQFEPSAEWLEHLRLSSIRFGNGASASFVSEDGLVMTNHHVGRGTIQKLSTPERNLLQNGFLARQPKDEIPCPDLELNVLASIEDVTTRVNAAVPHGADGVAAAAARRKVIAEIEKESLEATKLRSDVIKLYQGGQYHLYRYKRYTEVKLVFAPESDLAKFGGDPDNFEYPRYSFDVAIFRVYENGQPVKLPHYLRWSKNGPAEGELTFVSGHPGRTNRLLTMAELAFLRDTAYPAQSLRQKRDEVLLLSWAARSEENARRANNVLPGVQNGRKARDGGLAALYDPTFWAAKQRAETEFRQQLETTPEKFAEARQAFERIATAQKTITELAPRFRLLEQAGGFSGDAFTIARTLLRAAEELPKPNGQRLPEFGDAAKTSRELQLFSPKPIFPDLEILRLGDALQALSETLGAEDPLVVKVLAGKSPRARAAEVIGGTKVLDVATRRALYQGGTAAVEAARDPLIELARLVDPAAREVRKQVEAAEEVKTQGQNALAKARFDLQGTGRYPDATSSLRLSFGVVKGYPENGRNIPAMTDLAGLYQRAREHRNQPPFDLPASALQAEKKVNGKVPFNFVSTHDIIGGNSGSPMVNRAGEFVGLIFDGNLQSLGTDFAHDERVGRAVSVHSSAILEVLEKVYGATELVQELRRGKR
ncbi:MAG: S46 family peptidase [Verrucomicrobia bacterium]|nr:S46 family peptidase [Verrucomicrobiota bacterium]